MYLSGGSVYGIGESPVNVIIVDIHNQTDLKGLGRYIESKALAHIRYVCPMLA